MLSLTFYNNEFCHITIAEADSMSCFSVFCTVELGEIFLMQVFLEYGSNLL
jgi:hypothetical protein